MEAIVVLLAFAWVPTVIGLVRLWLRYWPLRGNPDMWLLQLFCVIATLVTPVVIYISWASSIHLLGGDPVPYGPFLGAMSAFIVALIVPLIEVRMQMWMNGSVPAPAAPNGKVNGGD